MNTQKNQLWPKLAFIGTGLMGVPMAENLLSAGVPLTVWNRTVSKAEPLEEQGASVAGDVREAVCDCDLVVLILEHAAASGDVLFEAGAAAAMKRGALVVDMGTVGPKAVREHAARLAELGIRHLDAPVSGGVSGAKAATLSIFAGGEAADFAEASPVLSVLGRATHVGPSGAGQVAKLVNQIIVAGTIGAVAEALFAGGAMGADIGLLREAMSGGYADSRILEIHGRRMVDRDFGPGGPNRIFLKDLDLVDRALRDSSLTLPLFSDILALYRDMVAKGLGEKDHSSLLLAIEAINGRGAAQGSMPDS